MILDFNNCNKLHVCILSCSRKILNYSESLYNQQKIVFTFVSDWGSEEIDLNTYRLYGRNIPSQEETSVFVDQVHIFK